MIKFAWKYTQAGWAIQKIGHDMRKSSADFSHVNISDLIERLNRGEINQQELQRLIQKRYMEEAQGPEFRDPDIFAHELKTFLDVIKHVEKDDNVSIGDDSNFGKAQKIKEHIAEFMKLNGRKYTNDAGELEEPFKSILQRLLIQKFNYDIELDEMVD